MAESALWFSVWFLARFFGGQTVNWPSNRGDATRQLVVLVLLNLESLGVTLIAQS